MRASESFENVANFSLLKIAMTDLIEVHDERAD
jgi:hypothetical protein